MDKKRIQHLGLAAVLSLTAFVLTLLFTILSFISERRRVHYEA